MTLCPICSTSTQEAFRAEVLNKYSAAFHLCSGCGYLFARDPHWLQEAYASPIGAADTGILVRNLGVAAKLTSYLYWGMPERGRGVYLDAAGGHGLLTRLMRDIGFNFYWRDGYAQNLFARGFDYSPTVGACTAITAIEVLEHLPDPIGFIRDLSAETGTKTLIFTTELYSGNAPPPLSWWYYAFPGGQHIGFFQKRTLQAAGQLMGMHFASANGIHILSRQPVSEAALFALTNRWTNKILVPLVRRALGSKTWSDHEAAMKSTSA